MGIKRRERKNELDLELEVLFDHADVEPVDWMKPTLMDRMEVERLVFSLEERTKVESMLHDDRGVEPETKMRMEMDLGVYHLTPHSMVFDSGFGYETEMRGSEWDEL